MNNKFRRKNKLNCEGENFTFFTNKNDKGTLFVGFDAAKEKHNTITHDKDGISSHLTKTNRIDLSGKKYKHIIKVLPEEARRKLSFQECRIVKVDPEWELWYPKENIMSIIYELTNKGQLPQSFVDGIINHFDSLVQLSFENKCLDALFKQITYDQILNRDYIYGYKVYKNGTITSIHEHSETEAEEYPLFSRETDNLLSKILNVKDLIPD